MNHTWLTFHKQALKQSLFFLSRRRVSTLFTVIVLSMTLSLSALFWVLTNNLSQVTNNWQRNGHISLYLDKDTALSEQASLLVRIQATPGVGEALLKTPEQGVALLEQQAGMEDLLHYLPDNPLPAVIDIIPAKTVQSEDALLQLYQVVKAYPHVEQSTLDLAWIKQLFAIFNLVTWVAHILMSLLCMAMVLIIGNTLRLIVQERHQEIEVLRLVGANDAFIMRPFLYSGFLYGFSAAILAMIGVSVLISHLDTRINQLFSAYQVSVTLSNLSFFQVGVLTVVATGLGWMAALLSVRQQLTSK